MAADSIATIIPIWLVGLGANGSLLLGSYWIAAWLQANWRSARYTRHGCRLLGGKHRRSRIPGYRRSNPSRITAHPRRSCARSPGGAFVDHSRHAIETRSAGDRCLLTSPSPGIPWQG